MKIEIKITDEAGNVQLYDVSGSLVSPNAIQNREIPKSDRKQNVY
jgi:hypothetical protein